jgi:hypothetical protein
MNWHRWRDGARTYTAKPFWITNAMGNYNLNLLKKCLKTWQNISSLILERQIISRLNHIYDGEQIFIPSAWSSKYTKLISCLLFCMGVKCSLSLCLRIVLSTIFQYKKKKQAQRESCTTRNFTVSTCRLIQSLIPYPKFRNVLKSESFLSRAKRREWKAVRRSLDNAQVPLRSRRSQ